MTITRHASADARRTWFRPAPRCLPGTTASPDAAPAQRPGSKQAARIAAAIVAIAVLAARRGWPGGPRWPHRSRLLSPSALALDPGPPLLLESASMAAFAIMPTTAARGQAAPSVGIRPMLATAYAANAVSGLGSAGRTRPWPPRSPSAASPGRAPMPRWPAGRCWPAG